MKTRILFGAIAMAVFLPVLIFSNTFIYPVVIALLSAIAAFELLRCARLTVNFVFSSALIAYAAACPIAVRFWHGIYGVALVTCAMILFCVVYCVVTQQTEKMNRIYSVAFTVIYVAAGFASTVVIRDGGHGALLMVLVFLIAWLTDTFAYFSGAAFGRHKLIPKLSPHKTVEGAIGGIVLTLIVTLIVLVGVGLFSDSEPRYLPLALLAIFASALSQIGDLAMSQIKRHYNVKDFGNLLPGHGGVLDRFDSVIAVSLTFTAFCYIFTNVRLF